MNDINRIDLEIAEWYDLNELFAGECIAEEKLKEKIDAVLMDVITNWLGHDKWESKECDTVPQNVLEVENVSKLYENVSTGHKTERNPAISMQSAVDWFLLL